jgi:hypothetical protein
VKNKIFAYSILGLNVVAGWIAWWVLASSIYGRTTHSWLYPVLAFGFWGVVFILSCIFLKNRVYIYSSYAVSGLGYLFFIKPGWSYIVAVFAILFFIAIEKQVKKEIERGVKIDFYHLVSHGLKYFVTTICLLIAVSYYFSITTSPTFSASIIEKGSLEMEMDWGLKAAGFILSDDKKDLIEKIESGITVDEYLMENIKNRESENIDIVSQSISADPSEVTKLIGDTTALKIQEEMLSKEKSKLSKQLGVNVLGEQPVKEVLMAYIEKTERSFFENTGSEKFYVPVILAFGIFLTARILGTAVDIFLGLFVLLLIKILRFTGVVSIRHEEKEVAMIEYSI